MGVFEDLGNDVRAISGVPPALKAAPFSGPVHEALHVVAVFPGEVKELAGV